MHSAAPASSTGQGFSLPSGGPNTSTLHLPYSAIPRAETRSCDCPAAKMMPAVAAVSGASASWRGTCAARRVSMASLAQACRPLRSITHGIEPLADPLPALRLRNEADHARRYSPVTATATAAAPEDLAPIFQEKPRVADGFSRMIRVNG